MGISGLFLSRGREADVENADAVIGGPRRNRSAAIYSVFTRFHRLAAQINSRINLCLFLAAPMRLTACPSWSTDASTPLPAPNAGSHFGNFVEKQRSALRGFHASGLCDVRACKRSLLVSKKFTFQQRLGDCWTMTALHEGLGSPRRSRMNRTSRGLSYHRFHFLP